MVLWAAHKPRVAITVWVHRVMPDLVLFGMGKILGPPQRVWAKAKPRERRAPIGYYPQEDGTLKDVWDHTIQMFEYLGPPIKK